MYKVELRRRAQRTLDRLPQTDFEAVVEAVTELAQTPRPRGMEKVKTTGLWRIRQGDYRITYVTGEDTHTDNVEGFWSQLKRTIDGTYHHVTAKHLQEYADEYSFRYNHRKDEQTMFTTMLQQAVQSASEKAWGT